MPPDAPAAVADAGNNLATALAYIQAIASGSAEAFAEHCTDDVELIEYPNRIAPNGQRRDLAAAIAAAHRGRALMAAQTYEIVSSITEGDRVCLELAWTGTLAIQLQHLAPGSVLTGNMAICLELRDGKICRQRNYDCYPPF